MLLALQTAGVRFAFPFLGFLLLLLVALVVAGVVLVLVATVRGEGLGEGGLHVTTEERLLEGIGDRRADFLRHLDAEVARRGVTLRPGTEGDRHYDSFLNRAVVAAEPEGDHLRYRFSLRVPAGALVLGVLLLVFLFVGGLVLFLLWYLKYGALKGTLVAAGEAAATLARTGRASA